MEKVDIYNYINYHLFLRDAFKVLKESNPVYTMRYIADKVGYNSYGHISCIFSGKRNLTLSKVPIFSNILKLTPKERRYFEAIVSYGNAKNHEEKMRCFRKIANLQKSAKRIVTKEQISFWDKWYYSAVKEMVAIYRVTDENYKEVSSHIIPKISPEKFKEALESLERIDIIQKDENGVYFRKNSVVSTGSEWNSLAIREYQRNIMALGQEALDNISPEKRDISTLTLSMSKENAEKIKKRLKDLREELLTIAKSDSNPEVIYQMGLLLFPVSWDEEGEK